MKSRSVEMFFDNHKHRINSRIFWTFSFYFLKIIKKWKETLTKTHVLRENSAISRSVLGVIEDIAIYLSKVLQLSTTKGKSQSLLHTSMIQFTFMHFHSITYFHGKLRFKYSIEQTKELQTLKAPQKRVEISKISSYLFSIILSNECVIQYPKISTFYHRNQ